MLLFTWKNKAQPSSNEASDYRFWFFLFVVFFNTFTRKTIINYNYQQYDNFLIIYYLVFF